MMDDTRARNPLFNANRFKLGIFSANCDGGLTMSLAPERWRANWDDIVAMCKAAEGIGVEGLLLGHPNSLYPTSEGQLLDYISYVCERTNLAVCLFAAGHWNFGRLHTSGYPPKVLARGAQEAGRHHVTWNGTDEHGATVHAIGAALYETFAYDEYGQLLTSNFYDYHVPHALDLPPDQHDVEEIRSG